MKRREFVGGLAAAASLTACAQEQDDCSDAATTSGETFEWSCVTSWPPRFPGLGMAPENVASR
ncbi:MAG: ABC transporter substrate-binding protein, partial [Gammaproteobacteria bacterium]|nr:ABC transporter substrate-binding protein [Gammaproteobacteria bacterium]